MDKMSKQQAEELRLFIKEMGWAMEHLCNFYNLSKPDENPTIDNYNPNQLNLFDNDER